MVGRASRAECSSPYSFRTQHPFLSSLPLSFSLRSPSTIWPHAPPVPFLHSLLPPLPMPVGTKVVEVAPTGRRIRRLPVASRQIRRPLSRIRCLRARGGLLPVLGAALCVVAADSCRGEGAGLILLGSRRRWCPPCLLLLAPVPATRPTAAPRARRRGTPARCTRVRRVARHHPRGGWRGTHTPPCGAALCSRPAPSSCSRLAAGMTEC